MMSGLLATDYHFVEAYNYVNHSWLSKIPFDTDTSKVGLAFVPVVALNNTLVVTYKLYVLRIDVISGNFTREKFLSTPTFTTVNQVPVVDKTAYLPGIEPITMVMLNSTATQKITSETQIGSELTKQFVTSSQDIIYMAVYSSNSRAFTTVFSYNIITGVLDIIRLVREQPQLTIAAVDDILLTFGNGKIYAIKVDDLSTWYEADFIFDFVPTISLDIGDGTFMVAGGRHATFNFFTDEILFINASAVIALGSAVTVVPTEEPISHEEATPSERLFGELPEGAFISVIVVPVAVAAGLTTLLVVLLKRRKKNKYGATSSLGLESRYGAWFTPFDQITFGAQLGQGASGQVFKGTWKNTTVALKVSMTQANQLVIRELELMMQLRPHPNVVQLLGFSVHPETNSIILIIEFCEGGSLDTLLYDKQEDSSLHTKLQWLTGAAKGLNHLHSNNIVHRDVAARNVLVHRNEPKLTDFGMSRLVEDRKQHGTTKSELGPIRWMAPESLKNKEYSTKSGEFIGRHIIVNTGH